MKKRIEAVFVFFLLLASASVAEAQKTISPPPEVKAYSGVVTRWTFNDDFIYDGFYLHNGQTTYYVKLSRYLGKQVRDLDDTITVNGVLKTSSKRMEIRMVNIQGKGQTVYDVKPAAGTTSSGEQFENGKAKITELYKNKKGEVYGFCLDNNTFLKVPSSLTRRLPQLEQTGIKIEYTGTVRPLKEGEAAVNNYKIVRCQTVSLEGTQYLVR